jgi:DnaT-like ssDNA binding protein
MATAFVVEDGTGLVNSNSYESLTEFSDYCNARGMDVTQYNDADKQQALIKAAEYIDLGPGKRFRGRRLVQTQALKFPRECLIDPEFCTFITGIPAKLKYAQSEYAYRELTTPGTLMPDPVVDDTGLQVLSTTEKVGPIEERKTYLGSSPKTTKPFPKADAFLRDYVTSEGARSYRA